MSDVPTELPTFDTGTTIRFGHFDYEEPAKTNRPHDRVVANLSRKESMGLVPPEPQSFRSLRRRDRARQPL
jgi:hypothetical protein